MHTETILCIAFCVIVFVVFMCCLTLFNCARYKRKHYDEYIHQLEMLELEKEKVAQIEEYKQLVKELREKVNRA